MIEYRLVTTPAEYKKCHQFLREHGEDAPSLKFPTVMAIQDNETLRGVMGTWPNTKALEAGPIFVDHPKNTGIIVLKLAEAYEKVLRAAGVSRYIFSIAKKYPEFIDYVSRVFQLEPYYEDDEWAWFQRVMQ